MNTINFIKSNQKSYIVFKGYSSKLRRRSNCIALVYDSRYYLVREEIDWHYYSTTDTETYYFKELQSMVTRTKYNLYKDNTSAC